MGGLQFGIVFGVVFGFAVWLLIRLRGGFVARLAVGFAEGEGSPQGPLESWRNDRVVALVVGLAFGLMVGALAGPTWGYMYGSELGFGVMLPFGFVFGCVFGLVVGLMYGMMSSETWSTVLAWRQLQHSRRVSAVGLMSFLEDARNRGVLRTVGAVYQFRHAILQDQLAEQTTMSPAIRLADQRPS